MRLSVLSFCFFLILTGCGSDDPPSVQNTITIDGSPFTIIAPTLIGVSIGGQGHAAISFTGITGSVSKTLSIDFEYSPSVTLSGSYSFPQTGTDRLLDNWLTNYAEMSTSGAGSLYTTNLDFGKITIQDNGGNNYTVTIDLTMLDGKVFKGTYRGAFSVLFNNS